MEKTKYSKMMQNYLETKKSYPDEILFYRLGDFYEMFFEDAEKTSKLLNITLTARDCGNGQRAPMCGIPHHASAVYIKRLIDQGQKIAICEQMSEPIKGQIVQRQVVQVITPGTFVDETSLETSNNFIASVCATNDTVVGLAWLDICTGEFYCQQFTGDNAFDNLSDVLVAIRPSEVIADRYSSLKCMELTCVKINAIPRFYNHIESAFNYNQAETSLFKQLNIQDLQQINCRNKVRAVCAAGALINYLQQTQMRDLAHINNIKVVNNGNYMHLDINTRLNLELCETLYEGKKKGSLLWVLDKTKTAMGARLLRSWLEHPLQDVQEINNRLSAVQTLIEDTISRSEIENFLSNINDLEKLCGRLSFGSLNPRNCVALGNTLVKLPSLKSLLLQIPNLLIQNCGEQITDLADLTNVLNTAFVDEPPNLIKDGGFIKQGYNADLDKCFEAKLQGQNWLNELESKERELTGIKVRIGYNKIAGYFFEVPKNSIDNLPTRFERLQSRVQNPRFTTNDLKKLEETILYAEEESYNIEVSLFNEIRQQIIQNVLAIQNCSRAIALVDVIQSLANVAIQNDYTKPDITEEFEGIEMKASRHPVVEVLMQGERFVPNDISLNKERKTVILTGPNMAGKSTYMRQIALIVLMTHIGSFVPADYVKIGITDRIFTRIGASDNLGMGQSTFMVEMSEVANIVKNATPNSLLILDEIGRGTSSQDGLSIAWAVLEFIVNQVHSFALFATHYHKLTELQAKLSGVVNMRVSVSEFNNQMSFLRKIEYGSTSQSFGIEVAKMAGLPPLIITRAKQVLRDQELEQGQMFDKAMTQYDENIQVNDNICNTEIINELKDIDINTLTPLEAISLLSKLKNKIQ